MTDVSERQTLAPMPPLPHYWTLQLAGWTAFGAFSYFSLNVWYNPGELMPALHTVVQSVFGIFLSHPLRWIARAEWESPMARRVVVNGAATLAAALVWTVLRLVAFTLMTGEDIGIDDWGGWIFGSATVFASWAFSYHALKYYRQWFEQRDLVASAQRSVLEARALAQAEKLKRVEAESLARDAHLRMLKYQLSPHFFFNALNSVTAMVAKGERDGAIEMIARVADFLRISLDADESLQHTIRDEVERLELYLGIEKIRFGERLIVLWDVSEDAMDATIPNLLLQPLVENCIKYGVGRTLSPVTIRLSAQIEGEDLVIRVADNGPGAKPSAPAADDQSHQIGLRNVEARLSSLYGDGFTFTHGPIDGNGFGVMIRIQRTSTEPAPALPA